MCVWGGGGVGKKTLTHSLTHPPPRSGPTPPPPPPAPHDMERKLTHLLVEQGPLHHQHLPPHHTRPSPTRPEKPDSLTHSLPLLHTRPKFLTDSPPRSGPAPPASAWRCRRGRCRAATAWGAPACGGSAPEYPIVFGVVWMCFWGVCPYIHPYINEYINIHII